MIGVAVAAAMLAAPPVADAGPPPAGIGRIAMEVLQLTVQRIVIRVPRRNQQTAASSNLDWRESAGPRCIPARQIAGAVPTASNVDLIMRDNSRIRAHLGQRCAALDYYRGLYVDANRDGQLCAGRDEIRSRMGGQCGIVQFRALRPVQRNR